MKHKNTQKLTLAAMTAAAYAALSLLGAVFGLTFGPIQVRFSEALCLLPFLFPETAWGLGVGCLIANLFSPYGALDIVVGSLSTLIAALLTARGEHFGQHDDIGIGGGHDRLQTFQVPGGVFPLHIDLTDSYAYFHRKLLFCNKYMKFSYSLHFLQEKSGTSCKTSRKFHAIRAYRRGAA